MPVSKILFVTAMESEFLPIAKRLEAVKVKKILHVFPLYKAIHKSQEVYIIQTFVGDMNSSIASYEAIKDIDPFL